jgi:muramoyltetrapeptide carboxypeptidase
MDSHDHDPLPSRRHLLIAAAATPLLGPTKARALTPPAYVAPPLRRPPRLKAGDTIGLVSPSGALAETDDRAYTEETVRALGFVPKHGRHTMDRFGYLAGRDEDRAADVNAMFADPNVKGIFCTRGGWGVARMLPFLDFNMIRANPKPVLGYSDITGLHLALQSRANMISFHGPGAASGWGPIAQTSFKEVLVDGATPTWRVPVAEEPRLVQRRWRSVVINAGKARGRMLGGNLTVLSALIGTPFMPDLHGAILVLEDIDEAEYRIDRMLTQLALAGILRGIAGFVFGQCTNCVDTSGGYGGFPLSAVLEQHIKPLGIPAFHGAGFGHIADQFFLPLGCDVELDANARTLRLLTPAVI